DNPVSTATMRAPRAIPRASLPAPSSPVPGSVWVSGRDGSARPAVSDCTLSAPSPDDMACSAQATAFPYLWRPHQIVLPENCHTGLCGGAGDGPVVVARRSGLGRAEPSGLAGRVRVELPATRAGQLSGQVLTDRHRLVAGRVAFRDTAGQALDHRVHVAVVEV